MPEIELVPSEYDVQDLERMQQAPRYIRWVFGLIAPHVGQRVLEVGAGIGNYSEFLVACESLTLVDQSSACCAALRSRFQSQDGVRVLQMDICNPDVLALRESRFDTIICLDVLEHTDDTLALRHMNALLAPGGILILKVPALPVLHGTIDEALGHHRRYRRKDLLALVDRAGFFTERHVFLNFIGALGWWINAHVLRRRKQSLGQIRFFDRYLMPLIVWWEQRWPPPLGQSLLVVCRKVFQSEPA